MPDRLISFADLKPRGITYSKPHIWRLEKAFRFPKRVRLGASRYAYLEREIDAFIERLVRLRDEGGSDASR